MKRYKHNLSHYKLLTSNMGKLLPVSCLEVLPGDTIQQQTSALIRLSPLQAPVMHPITVRLHHFFVPNRLIWDGWEDFITGKTLDSAVTYPTISNPGNTKNLLDYMGVPPVAGAVVSALPIRAYNLIYNEWYRDQDLGAERSEDDVSLPNISWEKDYFTSARPWPTKGETITLPLQGVATVSGANADLATIPEGTGPDINEFRKAFGLQRYQEARARYGSRYTEYLRYLGIRPSDARLQRPELLGGGRVTIGISEVLRTGNETAATDASAAIGEMKGHGIGALRSNRYRKFFEEHGHVITMLSVRPKAMYQDNLHRKWSRKLKEDYFQKELEAIGQQEVKNSEVFVQGSSADDDVFGYCDRYREYTEEPSTVSAEFRDVLNYWHLSREFSSLPALNQTFTDCIPTKRVFSEQTQHCLWMMVNHSVQARRMVRRNVTNKVM